MQKNTKLVTDKEPHTYAYFLEDTPEIREYAGIAYRSRIMDEWIKYVGLVSSGEICPGLVVPVLACAKSGTISAFPMKWGIPGESILTEAGAEIAARSEETREMWQKRRCIVPASWYFEHQHVHGHDGKMYTTDRYILQPEGSTLTWLCGIYRMVEKLPHFILLTRKAGEKLRFIHERMPLILSKEDAMEWIRPDGNPEEIAGRAITEMMWEKIGR